MLRPRLRRLLFPLLHHRPLSSSALVPSAAAALTPTAPPTNESVLHTLKNLKTNPTAALAFFTRASASHPAFTPSPQAHSLLLRILATPATISHFWQTLRSLPAPLDHPTYLTLLAALKSHNLTADRSNLAKFHSNSAGNALIASAAQTILQNPETKLDSIRVPLPLTEATVANILREVSHHPAKALAFFRWAGEQTGYANKSLAYNAMARVLGREETATRFWDLVEEMKGLGFDMDVDTYVKLSRQFQKGKMMEDAVALYEFMMDGPYRPSVQDCGLLLRRIATGGAVDLGLVFRVVRKYEGAGHSLSKMEFDGIHRSLTRVGKFDDAEEIVRRMEEAGYQPDNITYSQLVHGLCKAGRLDDACKVLDEMEECECVPDLKTWTILIQGHCSAGEVGKALECLTKMIGKGIDADGDLVEILVRSLCGEKKVEAAYTLLVELVESARLRPWQATYKYLIEELLKVGMLEESLKLLLLMKRHNFPPFADPFGPYIAKYGTAEDAKDFLKALTVNNYPTSTAYLKVFKCFFAEGRMLLDRRKAKKNRLSGKNSFQEKPTKLPPRHASRKGGGKGVAAGGKKKKKNGCLKGERMSPSGHKKTQAGSTGMGQSSERDLESNKERERVA